MNTNSRKIGENNTDKKLEKIAAGITRFTGSTLGLSLAIGIIFIWAICGPLFHFSDTWQLVINTGTTIITFLMVFFLQRAQNKDAAAFQLKLNEIIVALKGASNRMISIEDLTEQELNDLKERYNYLTHMLAHESDIRKSHSVEDVKDDIIGNLKKHIDTSKEDMENKKKRA